jgi:hypothetical protein
MHRSGTQHALLVGVVLACCVLAMGACGSPEEAKPRPLPEETRKLSPGTYRTEEFEPAFSFRVGEGWSTAQPEVYDILLIARADGGGRSGLREPRGGAVLQAHQHGHAVHDGRAQGRGRLVPRAPVPGNPRDRSGEGGGVEGTRIDYVVDDLPDGYDGGCASGCVPLLRFSSGGLPLVLFEEDKARLIVLEDVRGETVITGFGIRAAEFDEHAPEAQKVLDTVEWRGG